MASQTAEYMAATATHRRRTIRRSFPLFGLLAYYGGLVILASVLIAVIPGYKDALLAPIAVSGPAPPGDIIKGNNGVAIGAGFPPPPAWGGVGGRGALTLTAMMWAMAASLPVAWTLTQTRRLRYDPSLVHTLIVLPIVVAGVVLVVKNSLALAFALAGIVAGVRFRQKLDEPEEAVYVLLALGIGLAAGVQALDVALVMSMAFTMIVMTFWRYDIGSIYSKGKGAQLTIGDPRLLMSSTRDAAREDKLRETAIAEGLRPEGLLIVRTSTPEGARQAIETVAGRLASEWRLSEPTTNNGLSRFEAVLKLKKDCDPAELVAELEARWSDEIAAAEYVPLSTPSVEA
jgi:hypothetical protein